MWLLELIQKHLSEDEIMYETYETVLCHHGIMGMKWGVRRFQDKNGNLTSEGRQRYESKSSYKTGAILNKDLNEYKRQKYNKFKSEMSDVRAQKRNGLITNKEARQIRKNKIANAKKDYEREREAAVKAFAQTTKRGKNIVTGLLATAGGFGATVLSEYAAENGRIGASIVGGLAGSALMGIGLSNLVNETAATKYRKEAKK